MSALLDSYENELKQALKKAKNVMNNFHFANEGEKQNSIKIVKEKIREAELNYNKMQAEYSTESQARKALLKKKVEAAFKEVDETRKRFIKLESDYIDASNRENLMREATKDKGPAASRENLNEALFQQNKGFGNINKIAHETLAITNNANVNLLEQRDVMVRIKQDNAENEEDLYRIDKLTTIMSNRDLFNKAILWLVVFLLLITNIIVFYVKARRLFS